MVQLDVIHPAPLAYSMYSGGMTTDGFDTLSSHGMVDINETMCYDSNHHRLKPEKRVVMLRIDILILIITTVVLAILSITFFLVSHVLKRRNEDHEYDGLSSYLFITISKLTLTGLAAISALLLVLAMIPFNAKYMTITQYHGTIASINTSTAVVHDGSDNGIITPSYLVKMDNDNNQYTSTDIRLLGYHKGDDIRLACTWEWHYGAADQLTCTVA